MPNNRLSDPERRLRLARVGGYRPGAVNLRLGFTRRIGGRNAPTTNRAAVEHEAAFGQRAEQLAEGRFENGR